MSSDFVKSLLDDLVIPRPLVGIILAFRRWLWLLVVLALVVLACSIVANISYYLFQIGQDQFQSVALTPGDRRIAIIQPASLLYSTKPYSLTLASTPALTQSVVLKLRHAEGIFIAPNESKVFTFTQDVYQSYQLQFSNNQGLLGPALLMFEQDLPTNATATIQLTKETYASSLWRKLFVINSLTDGIIPLLIPLMLLVLSSTIQREQRRARELVDQLKVDLASSKSNTELVPAFQKLKARLSYLPTEERRFLNSFLDLSAQQHFESLLTPSLWHTEHLGRAIAAHDKAVARKLLNLHDQHKLELDSEQLRRVTHLAMNTSPPVILPAASPEPDKQNKEFDPRAIEAEHDQPSKFCDLALPSNYQPDTVWAALERHELVVIVGAAGSGKTALLRRLLYCSQDSASEPTFPLYISTPRTAPSSHEMLTAASRAITESLLRCLYGQIDHWIYLPEPQQRQLIQLAYKWFRQDQPLDVLMHYVRQHDDELAARHLRELSTHIPLDPQALSRISPELAFAYVVDIINELNFRHLLICLDQAPSSITPSLLSRWIKDAMEQQAAQLSILVSIAYRADVTAIPAHVGADCYPIELRWSREHLGRLLDHRSYLHLPGTPSPFVVNSAREQLLDKVSVPRDFWPWWSALAAVRAGVDITPQHLASIAPYMDAARRQRDSQDTAWTMTDSQRAILAYTARRERIPE